MFVYAPKTVSYAKELTSESICYSQRDGFNTPLSRLLQLYCIRSRLLVVILMLCHVR